MQRLRQMLNRRLVSAGQADHYAVHSSVSLRVICERSVARSASVAGRRLSIFPPLSFVDMHADLQGGRW
jgi:hypothetical protein